MINIIENEFISCTTDSYGAQMISLKDKAHGSEYIWCGNPSVWKWHAPVLFPFCGNFPEGYRHNGTIYHLPQHGFLRNVEHTCISDGVFLYETGGESGYPFAFSARTVFTLDGKTLTHRIQIKNTGKEILPFSLGFHTGFALSNATLEFEKYEPELDGKIFAADDVSMSSTRFFTGIESTSVACSDENGKKMIWSSSGYTTLVLWTSPGHSRDYICIEPRIDTIPDDAKKPFRCFLEPGSETSLEERITIL